MNEMSEEIEINIQLVRIIFAYITFTSIQSNPFFGEVLQFDQETGFLILSAWKVWRKCGLRGNAFPLHKQHVVEFDVKKGENVKPVKPKKSNSLLRRAHLHQCKLRSVLSGTEFSEEIEWINYNYSETTSSWDMNGFCFLPTFVALHHFMFFGCNDWLPFTFTAF